MIGETVVDMFKVSPGRDKGQGFYSTASGTCHISGKDKGRSHTPYANAYIAYWAGFDPSRDNRFHARTMDKYGNVIDGGWEPTGDCVATKPEEAALLYDFVEIGTRVEIHWERRPSTEPGLGTALPERGRRSRFGPDVRIARGVGFPGWHRSDPDWPHLPSNEVLERSGGKPGQAGKDARYFGMTEPRPLQSAVTLLSNYHQL